MAANPKDITLSDIATMFMDLMHGDRGPLSNTVFAAPRSPSEYDSLAFEDRQYNEKAFRRLFDTITGIPTRNRTESLVNTYGLGDVGSGIQNIVQMFDKGAGQAMIGHHGGDDAVRTLLQAANGIAAARGREPAGVLSPIRRDQNLQFAALMGGMVYGQNFNPDGSVNVEQTKGLTLNEASYVSGRTLSERTQYEDWGRRMKARGPDLTEDEKKMSDQEINDFVNGVKSSERAARSFANQIGKFNGGLNEFVASASKLTGDTMKAVELLQRLTGGKFFQTGKDADAARQKAESVINMTRVAAVNAGLSPQQLMYGAEQLSGTAAQASGFQEMLKFGGLHRFSQTGLLAATAYGKWLQANPKATEEERTAAGNAVSSMVEGYMGSSMNKLNLYAAKLKDSGVDLTGYEEALRTGNARAAQEILIRQGGGRMNLANFMSDTGAQARALLKNTQSWQDFSATSMLSGRDNEAVAFGRERLFRENMRDSLGRVSNGSQTEQQKLNREAMTKYRDAYLSDEALKAAGMENATDREMFRKRLGNRNTWEIRRELGALGLDDNAATQIAMASSKADIRKTIQDRTMNSEEETRAVDILKGKEKDVKGETLADVRKTFQARYGVEADRKIQEYLKGTGLEGKASKAEGEAALKNFDREMGRISPEVTADDRKQAISNIARTIEAQKLGVVREKAAGGDRQAFTQLENQYGKSVHNLQLTERVQQTYDKALKSATGEQADQKVFSAVGETYAKELTSAGGQTIELSEEERSAAYKDYLESKKSNPTKKDDITLQKEAYQRAYDKKYGDSEAYRKAIGGNLSQDIFNALEASVADGLSAVEGVKGERRTSPEGLKLSNDEKDAAYRSYLEKRKNKANEKRSDADLQKEAVREAYDKKYGDSEAYRKAIGGLDKTMDSAYRKAVTSQGSLATPDSPSEESLKEAGKQKREVDLESQRVALNRTGSLSETTAAAGGDANQVANSQSEALISKASRSTATELDKLSKVVNQTVSAMDALRTKEENRQVPTDKADVEQLKKVLAPEAQSAKPEVNLEAPPEFKPDAKAPDGSAAEDNRLSMFRLSPEEESRLAENEGPGIARRYSDGKTSMSFAQMSSADGQSGASDVKDIVGYVKTIAQTLERGIQLQTA